MSTKSNEAQRPPHSEKRAEEGYRRAIELMHGCLTEHGFLATPTEQDNYRRVWGRDSVVIGLAGLLSGDRELTAGCRHSLETLARYQGPHGEIPSNVDPQTDRVSYGGTAGRVDADLWFVIGCGEYFLRTEDQEFLKWMIEPLENVRFLLGAWEFNTRGLLYVPPTGDWADEYLQSGYVLYDQLLYYQAQKTYAALHKHLHGSSDHDLHDRLTRLKHLIRDNYWFPENGPVPDDVYHEVLYEQGRSLESRARDTHWLPFFSPIGYGYRFDAMANVLASLFGVADRDQCEKVDRYIVEQIVDEDVMVLPAFAPVITPKDEKWEDLQVTFSHTFKNAPYEYHNGGLWPLVTGFYAADLEQRGQPELARRYRDGVHRANAKLSGESEWSFPEYLHGQTHAPGGTRPMGWSAAAAVIAEQFAHGNRLFH